ncbi:MAG: PQQ-binding-like beta-propeller repeat protein [Planctomycetota bacterium]
MRRQTVVSGIACFVVLLLWQVPALAFLDVISGTVVSVSRSTGQVVVQLRGKTQRRSFRVTSGTRMTLDGKKVPIAQVQKGQLINAFVNGTSASRVLLRTDPDKKAESTTPKPSKPNNSPAGMPDSKPSTTSKKSPRRRRTGTASPTSGMPATAGSATSSGEWNQFRGPNRDNVSPETGLLSDWPGSGPELAWTATGIGEGYSSVAVSNGRLFTMGNRDRAEAVTAIDLATGREIWSVATGREYHEGQGNGPRGTPTIVDGRLYALGGNGDLACLEVESGEIVWKKNILQDFGGSNITWGISESVLIDGDRLICTPGGSRGTMVALNRNTGGPIWTAQVPGNPRAAYSSAIAVEGREESANSTANCSTPVFFQNHIFTASGYGTGGALFQLQSRSGMTGAQPVFQTREMKNHHGGMVVVDGFLYGCDEQILKCINLRNGQIAWKSRSVGKGSVTCADGHLYVRSEDGPVALVEVNSREYIEKGRFDQPRRSGRPAWPHPVVADGKLFLRDMDTLLAYDVKSR